MTIAIAEPRRVVKRPKQPQTANALPKDSVPSLQAGDFLTRAEFERRYHTQPELKKAELIEGIVYMSSPVRARQHADPHFDLIGLLAMYRFSTPGVRGSDNATLRLDSLNEPQPDALLRLERALGGASIIDADGYLSGAPELVLEIAASTASYDMNQKRMTYARHGIQEYLVVLTDEQRFAWFGLEDGIYRELPADNDGVVRSEVFPGLWLHPTAFWNNDTALQMAILQQGIASPEHMDFVASLQPQSTLE